MLTKRPNNLGFSLLEVIVAMAIMGVGFVTVLRLFSEGIRTLDYSDQYLKAITLANNKLTELEVMDFEVDTFSGVFQNEPNYRWELFISPYESILTDPLENILPARVVLRVLWNDISKERNIELVTIRTWGKNYSAADAVIQGASKGERVKLVPTPPVAGSPSPSPAAAGSPGQNANPGAVAGGIFGAR